ncbi:MAG: patatin-like phospholipase family protein [Methylococcales bacterium]
MNTSIGCKRGLGLCLSGGGFRASFYHIGILIQMAELGLLRQVEVISTVSGGSILGAAYYLKVKNLLESKADDEIFDSDYVKLVNELETEFLEAVQKNLRVRTFANPVKNMMMARPKYSRSDALAELYENHIYQQYLKPSRKWISMRDLLINPNKQDISPCDKEKGNEKRINKIPVIILNATSLNSGHNWYFSARSMGEVPPRNAVFKDIDKKDRYRRIRYDDIKGDKKEFPLGSAVAASAGVPGLFPPMAVTGMYEERRVQLIDGGVFDNQGVNGALDPLHVCQSLVVSDASGQSEAIDNPETGLVKVLGMTNSIMMGRVREEVVNGLNETTSNPQTHPENLAYFHLTRGLFAKNINGIEQKVNLQSDQNQLQGLVSSMDDFHVNEEMQLALAHIRTDLDSFTHVEAGSLIANGYMMSKKQLEVLKQSLPDSSSHTSDENRAPEKWIYKDYIDKLTNKDELLLKHLQIASKQFLKPYYHLFGGTLGLGKSIGLILWSMPMIIVLGAILYGLNWLMLQYSGHSLLSVITDTSAETFLSVLQKIMSDIAQPIYWLLFFMIISTMLDKLIEGSGKWVGRIRMLARLPVTIISMLVTRLVLPLLGAIPVNLYLYTIDRYFVKKIGKLD